MPERKHWLAAGVLAVVLLLAVTHPFWQQLRDGIHGGRLSALGQLNFWLSWQIWDNLRNLRVPWDSSVLVVGGDLGLIRLVGLPGPAAFLWPLQVAGGPLLAWNLGLLLIAWTNVMGAWVLGHALRRPGESAPLSVLALLAMATSGWCWAQLAQGALAAVWLGPALAAIGFSRMQQPRLATAAAAVGLLGAPLLTGLLLVGALFWEKRSPWGIGLAALFFGLWVPVAGVDGGAPPPLDAVLGFSTGASAAAGLPLWVLPALWMGSRGYGRWVIVACWLLLCGPMARDGAGELLELQGYQIPLGPEVGWIAEHRRELIGAAMGLALIPGLRAAAGLTQPTWLLLGAFLLVQPALQAAWGQPVALAAGAQLQVPEDFRKLAVQPRQTAILQLPLFEATEGGLFWVPFHQQRVWGGPGLGQTGPLRAALDAEVRAKPAIGNLLNLKNNPRLARDLLQAGYGRLLLVGGDPSFFVFLQGQLGSATEGSSVGLSWDLQRAASGTTLKRPEADGTPPGDTTPPGMETPEDRPPGAPLPPEAGGQGGGMPTPPEPGRSPQPPDGDRPPVPPDQVPRPPEGEDRPPVPPDQVPKPPGGVP